MKYTKISANAAGEKNLKKWERPKNTDFGEYVVDDSKFIPMSEAVKRAATQGPIGNDIAAMVYDFPDGKVKKMDIPFTRTKDGKGMAEISKDLQEKTKKITKDINAARKAAAEQAAIKASFETDLKAEK